MKIHALLTFSVALALSGCVGNASISDLDAKQKASLTRLELYEGDPDREITKNLGPVSGVTCQRNGYAPAAGNRQAMEALKIQAAGLDANAVVNVGCYSSSETDWVKNCWSTVTCMGEAVLLGKPREPSITEGVKGSQGSCFFASRDGRVVTNFHVVEGKSEFQVIDNRGAQFNAVIENVDPANDLAALRVDTQDHKWLSIAPFGSLKTGQRIFVVGYPVSAVLGDEVKFTDGVVSSTTGMNNMASMFQMSAPIQPGNSGGPVLNEKGQVVGIATSTAAVEAFLRNTGSLPQNVNWAVKSEYVSLLTGIQGSDASRRVREDAIDAAIGASCMVKAR